MECSKSSSEMFTATSIYIKNLKYFKPPNFIAQEIRKRTRLAEGNKDQSRNKWKIKNEKTKPKAGSLKIKTDKPLARLRKEKTQN